MALFAIADLHLSRGAPKPMDVFGHRWQGYTEKLTRNWRAAVKENDTVIVPGDISWAMRLSEARADFELLDALPGRKLLGKGNHDYWWETLSKMRAFTDSCGFKSIGFLHNNAYIVEDFIVCGTRGWFLEERLQKTGEGEADYKKLCAREVIRLRASLDEAKRLRETDEGKDKPILVFLHFPPVFGDFVCEEYLSLMAEYGVAECFYGHIHGRYDLERSFKLGSVKLTMIASDYLNFTPLLIK